MIHSKVMIVDDRLLRIGSANLNNRSMGDRHRMRPRGRGEHRRGAPGDLRIRDRLLADHCGVRGGGRGWRCGASRIADRGRRQAEPQRPLPASGRRRRARPGEIADSNRKRRRSGSADCGRLLPAKLCSATGTGGAARCSRSPRRPSSAGRARAGLALSRRWRRWRSPRRCARRWPLRAESVGAAPGARDLPRRRPGGVSGHRPDRGDRRGVRPWLGLPMRLPACWSSAIVTYAIGARLGKETLRNVLGPRLNRVRRASRGRASSRSRPSGWCRSRRSRWSTWWPARAPSGRSTTSPGPCSACCPGLVVLSVLGHQVVRILSNPTWAEVALLAAAVAAWIACRIGLQVAVTRLGSERP